MVTACYAVGYASAAVRPGPWLKWIEITNLATALVITDTIHKMPFEVNIWQAQNIWNDLLRRSDMNYWTPEWKEDFKKLGRAMNISVDQLVIEEGVSAF